VRRLTLGVVCACVAVVLTTAAAVASPRIRDFLGFTKDDGPSYRVGGVVDVPAKLYEGASYTLIVFARASCGGCQYAKPVFAEMVRQVRNAEDARVSFIMPSSSPAESTEYARAIGVPESSVFLEELRSFRLKAVPTALLVDHAGRIVAVSERVDSLQDLAKIVASRVNGT
jgi:hypothetical protein